MKIKWGVLGTAGIARWATIPGMIESEYCDRYAIAGRDEQKVNRFREEFGFKKAYVGYEQLLADPEVQAVYIPLPHDIHFEWVIKALNAKKHVLCEKPLALNAEQAQKMFDAARENNVILAEAYAYLHSPYIDSLKKDIDDGLIGRLDFIDTAFVTQAHLQDFRLHKEFGGGALYDVGCYCTTLILSLIDSELADLNASAEFVGDVDWLTNASLKFANGARATFTAGMVLDPDSNSRFDRLYIHGSKGCIKSDVEYNQSGSLKYTVFSQGQKIERTLHAPQNYALELDQLNRCILFGDPQHVTPDFSIKNARLIDAVLKKIKY